MGYVVRQVVGKFSDQAKEYERLRTKVSMEQARDYLYKVAEFPVLHIPPTSVWWIYNASDALRMPHGVLVRDIEKFTGKKFEQISDRELAEATCKVAAQMHGGTWDYFPEY